MDPYQIPTDDQQFAQAHRVAYLIAGFLQERLTPAEHDELDAWVEASTENLLLFEELTDEHRIKKSLQWFEQLDRERHRRRILQKLKGSGRQRWKGFALLSVAACLMLVVGLGLFGYLYQAKSPPSTAGSSVVTTPSGQPTLALGNGRVITLDSGSSGMLALRELGVTQKEGELRYGAAGSEAVYHTLTIPTGKQFRLLLSDGSSVVLNAQSSLRFPTVFPGGDRLVELTGEAYFEVAKDPGRPFWVRARGTTVEVLGTHFLVTAYPNEPMVKTTLVEGQVRVRAGAGEAVLQPGEQASVDAPEGSITLDRGVDLESALAWKEGKFLFRHTPLPQVMQHLQRWYGIRVDYQAGLGDRFTGTFRRDLPLDKILEYLQATRRVRFERRGEVVVVRSFR